MPLADSPTFEISSPTPPITPGGTGGQTARIRWLMLALALIAGMLAVYILQGPAYGTINGSVRDIDGAPIQVSIFMTGMVQPVQTDAQGGFSITNVPDGHNILTINHQGNAVSFQVEVPKWDSLDIGQIQIDTSA
jgi:hypothetical protein